VAQEATRHLKIVKAPGWKGVSSGVLEYLLKWAVTILVKACNAVFRTRYFPAVWKYARVISKLKPGTGSTLSLFYQQNRLLDTTNKWSNRLRSDYCVKGSLVFDSDPARRCSCPFSLKESTGTLTKRANRSGFLRFANVSQLPNLPSKKHVLIPLNTEIQTFFPVGSLWYARWYGQGWTNIPVLSSLYVNMNMSLCLHVEFALLAEQTAIIATSYQPTLLVICLQTWKLLQAMVTRL